MGRSAAILLIGLALAAQTPPPNGLAVAIERALAVPSLDRAIWGMHVRDLATGKVLYERNAGLPMTPASNTKLFSSALALLRLGPDHRFKTRILADGAMRNATLSGDLVIEGGGDPTLSPRQIPYRKGAVEGDPLVVLRELAARVAEKGVRRIEGDVVGDDTLYPWDPYPEGWSEGDTLFEYGAAVSALFVNDNSIRLAVRPGRQAGDPAEITLRPPVEYFTILNQLNVAPGAPRRIRVDRVPGGRMLRVRGTAPPGSAESWQLLAADDPALFAAEAFRRLLTEQGIEVRGRAVARHRLPGEMYTARRGTVLAERVSPPLAETLKVLNKVSQNLHAEIVLLETARVRRGDATRALALEELDVLLKEIGAPAAEADLTDGSGLSRRGLVSPRAVTTLLEYMHRTPHQDLFWQMLPVAGEDGTLATRFRGLQGAQAIRAKTGTVSHVSALSGYAGLDPARRAAFSIICNHHTAPSSEIRSALDRIAVAILDEGYR